MAELITKGHRPRNVDWKRAAALLYGDWGTSKAYVIGLAFVAAGYRSMPIIIAVCVLTGVVGYMYGIVCKYFPDGGGVYSAARSQSRLLASLGALLLVAGFTVTAAISGFAALSYLKVPPPYIAVCTMFVIALIGVLNVFGPKHSGSVAVWLALPMVAVVLLIIGFAAPHLTTTFIQSPAPNFLDNWRAFVGVILALSGVEAVANMTGVMKPDAPSGEGAHSVVRTSRRTLLPVAIEVVLGTTLLGWAMLSVPTEFSAQLHERYEDMLRFLAEYYGTVNFGPKFGSVFGFIVGIVVALLLLSAVNTSIVAMIGVLYMMSQDGEMPRALTRLNKYGVPHWPLIVSVVLPVITLFFAKNTNELAGLYAIGVVGAIAVNMGACAFNGSLKLDWKERLAMALTFALLMAVELTLAKTRPEALFFAICVVGAGLALRAYSHKLSGLKTVTVAREVAELVTPATESFIKPKLVEAEKILVSARGLTPVLQFAVNEAQLHRATLYVLYVKEIAVFLQGPGREQKMRWQEDEHASAIMSIMLQAGEERGVTVVPIFTISEDPAATILDVAATLGADYLMLGSSHRLTMAKLLKGNVIERVAKELPESIQLIIHG